MKKKKKEKKKIKLSTFKILLKYAKNYKKRIIFFVTLLITCNLLGVFTGYLVGQGTEYVTKGNIKLSMYFLLAYILVEFITYCGTRAVTYFLNKYQINICRKISYDTYVKTMNLPAYAFEKMSSGEIINRVTKDTESILGLIQSTILFLSRTLSTLLVFIYVIMNSWIIALELVFFIVAYMFPLKYFRRRMKETSKETRKAYDDFTQITVESVRGIREIKTLGLKNKLANMLEKKIKDLIRSSNNKNFVSVAFDVVNMTFAFLMEGCIFI